MTSALVEGDDSTASPSKHPTKRDELGRFVLYDPDLRKWSQANQSAHEDRGGFLSCPATSYAHPALADSKQWQPLDTISPLLVTNW